MRFQIVSIVSILACLLGARSVSAQWVSFTEETDARLSLSTVPLNDGEEKDIAIGDLDQDGDVDVIVARKRPFSNEGPRQDVLLMNEDGVLVDRTVEFASEFISNPTDARDLQIVDLDGDGWKDVIIANTFFQAPTLYMNLGNDGKGNWLGLANETFRLGEITSTSPIKFCGVAVGDVNGDEMPDLFFSNYDGGNDVLMMNDGKGDFVDETVARLGNLANVAFGTGGEIVDVDNDGDNDIVRCNTLGGPGMQIMFNTGDGTFATMQNVANSSAYMFTMGHFNDDDMIDMYVVQDPQDRINFAESFNQDQSVNYSSWNLEQSPRTTGFGGNIHSVDIDGDGDLDVGVGPIDVDIQNCGAGDELALLQNPGDGHVFDPWPSNQSQNFHIDPHDFMFLDINGDGCLDIFMGLCTGWRVFIQDCPETAIAKLTDFEMLRGTHVGGSLDDLLDPDDVRFETRSQFGFTALEPNVSEVVFGSVSPFSTVTDLDLIIEISGDTPNTSATVRMRNWNNNNNVLIGGFNVGLVDATEVFDDFTNPNRFVRNSDGRIEVTLKTVAPATFTPQGFLTRLDLLEEPVVN